MDSLTILWLLLGGLWIIVTLAFFVAGEARRNTEALERRVKRLERIADE